MLPIVDYGGIAIVVPYITAVGDSDSDGDKFSFDVYLNGMESPLVVSFTSMEEAEESRDELIAIIAQYHLVKEFGPDFNFDELDNIFNNLDDDNKDKH